MSRRRYKFDIYARGVVSTTGTISWTFATSRFPASYAPTVGGQIARPTQGVVESQPWTVSILDVGSSFTGLLGDSSGRLQHIGRLVRMRLSLDSTASTSYTTLAVGRVVDVALSQSIAAYDLTIADERWVERQQQIFTRIDDSVSLLPGGLVKNAPGSWMYYPGGGAAWTCRVKVGRTTLLVYTDAKSIVGMEQPVGELIANDIKPNNLVIGLSGTTSTLAAISTGNFRHLRFRATSRSSDQSLLAFGYINRTIGGVRAYAFPPDIVEAVKNGWSTRTDDAGIWVVWSSTSAAPAKDAVVRGYVHAGGIYAGSSADKYLAPSRAVPLLIGGAAGLHPADLVANAYHGMYSPSSATQIIRYSTAQMAAWKGQSIYGKVWVRITKPENMSEFLERRLYQPYGMLPTIDSSGKVSPQSVLAPTSNDVGTVANVLRLTSTNLTTHPTWGSQSRELVNAIDFSADRIVVQPTNVYGQLVASLLGPFESADRLVTTTQSLTRNHDNTTKIGRRNLGIRYLCTIAPVAPTTITFGGPAIPEFGPFTSALARSYFSRFGDGPLYTDVQALPTIDQTTRGKIQVGDYVAVKLGTYPNVGTNTRGSTRLMQVMGRVDGPLGIYLTLLDAGAASNPLSAPSLTLALSSQSSRHGVKATVSSLTGSYEIRAAGTSTGGSVPSETSTKWRTILVGTTANTTQHYLRLASKTKWWAEVRALKPGRITSPWSTARNAVTAKITGPTSFLTTGLSGGIVGLKWKYGSSLYGLQIMASNTTADILASSRVVQHLPALSTRTRVGFLDFGVKHKFGVRHYDPYGGFSTAPTVTATPSTVSVAAPNLRGIIILQGNP